MGCNKKNRQVFEIMGKRKIGRDGDPLQLSHPVHNSSSRFNSSVSAVSEMGDDILSSTIHFVPVVSGHTYVGTLRRVSIGGFFNGHVIFTIVWEPKNPPKNS